jgi:hypothetical protein
MIGRAKAYANCLTGCKPVWRMNQPTYNRKSNLPRNFKKFNLSELPVKQFIVPFNYSGPEFTVLEGNS